MCRGNEEILLCGIRKFLKYVQVQLLVLKYSEVTADLILTIIDWEIVPSAEWEEVRFSFFLWSSFYISVTKVLFMLRVGHMSGGCRAPCASLFPLVWPMHFPCWAGLDLFLLALSYSF